MNVNVVNIHNVYNETVVNRGPENRVAYNGGNGGVTARPTPQEEAAARERHLPPIAAQTQHRDEARTNPQLRASANQGRPPIAATERPCLVQRTWCGSLQEPPGRPIIRPRMRRGTVPPQMREKIVLRRMPARTADRRSDPRA